jgi:IMP cyclohydrolase
LYVGRIVAVGSNRAGRLAAMYRVSSRSFPNRMPAQMGEAIAVVPKPGFESDIHRSPYIAYNCLRLTDRYAVVANGTHTDPVAEKLAAGMGMRDALSVVLSALDYERDDLCTPRIAGVVDLASRSGALAIVRRDALVVREFDLAAGVALYVATYERIEPGPGLRDEGFDVATAEAACRYVLGGGVFADFERPVLAAAALEGGQGFEVASVQQAQEHAG